MTATAKVQTRSRDQLLSHAARLFSELGYAATTLRGIAAEAGITAASLYYHFKSKDEIVIEVLNLGISAVHREVATRVEALDTGTSGRELLQVAIAAHLRSLLELQDFTSANTRIFGQVEPDVREATLAVRRAYEEYWQALLVRVVGREPPIPLLMLFLFGAMNGALTWYRPDGPQSIDEIAAAWVSIILDGVGGWRHG